MRSAHGSSHPRGEGGLPQCMLGYTTPEVWAWRPPPPARPLSLPPGCGPGDPPMQGILGYYLQGMLEYHPPPPGYLQGMLRYHLQCMLGYHTPSPLWTEFLTHAFENITLPQTCLKMGCNLPFLSESIVFNENNITNVIADGLIVDGDAWYKRGLIMASEHPISVGLFVFYWIRRWSWIWSRT